MKNTESEAKPTRGGLAASAVGHPLTCAGTSSNSPHDSTLRTRSKNCRQGSKKRCPVPRETKPSRQITAAFRIITSQFPCTKSPPSSQKNERSRPRRLPTMNRTEGAQPCCQPRRDPLRAKSAPVAVATSAVLQRCPAPRWRMPSNTRHRETLQAAKQQPSEDPRPPTEEHTSWRRVGDPLFACPLVEMPPPVEATMSSGPAMSLNRSVPRDDASKEVATPSGVAVARPKAGPGFHPGTMCSKDAAPGDALSRESDACKCHRHPPEVGKVLRPEREAPTARVRRSKPARPLRPLKPRGDSTAATPIPSLQTRHHAVVHAPRRRPTARPPPLSADTGGHPPTALSAVVTPAFLAPNKSPNKSCVFSKLSS
jgi:hypothetical protein